MASLAQAFDAATDEFDAEIVVEHVRFARPDGTWAVVQGKVDATLVTFVGPLAHLTKGDRARARGRWGSHGTFGRQVEVSSAEPLDPADDVGRMRLLETLPGVGSTVARSLLQVHGERLFDLLDSDPLRTLSAAPRFNAAKGGAAATEWSRRRSQRDLYVLLACEGLARLAAPLADRYGAEALPRLRSNPYMLTAERGVAFSAADRIAARLGIRGQDARRIEAIVVHVLGEAEEEGHTFLLVDDVARAARRYLGPLDSALLAAALPNRQVVLDGDRAALYATHHAEISIAARLVELSRSPLPAAPRLPPRPPPPYEYLSPDEQWAAVRRAFEHGVSVIAGGPGVGKTSAVRAIVATAQASGMAVALCAPAGRAARRLEQASGHPASTLHALLEWGQGDSDGPQRHSARPLDADIIIVDEASMVDTHMMWALLDATSTGRRLVFVGDPDQLPSVGAGKVLADLIASGIAAVTRLTRVFRQARNSMIIRAAHQVNAGRIPSFAALPDVEVPRRDLFFISQDDVTRIPALVGDLVAERLPRWGDIDPLREITVLAPSKRAPHAGVSALNEYLAQRLNPDGERLQRLPHLRVGDKVMWTRNDRDLRLTNGTILFVKYEDQQGQQILCVDEDQRVVAIPWDKANSLRAAYALTVHKAQGCEVPVVVIVMHRQGTHPSLLCRSLLYTALTRARDTAVIVGERAALAAAVARATALTRNSTLLGRLLRAASV